MTGLILIARPPNQTHLRLRLVLDGEVSLELMYWDRRGLGSVRLLNPAQFANRYSSDKLGPDALAISPDDLQVRLRAAGGKSRSRFWTSAIAGIGNLYASETLHAGHIHPARRCDSLKPAEWQRLHTAMREVLLQAIRYEGSTLSDGTYRNALNQNGNYQNQHRVYDKTDQICLSCGRGRIARIVQGQRSTFFCPRCQPLRKGRVSSSTA